MEAPGVAALFCNGHAEWYGIARSVEAAGFIGHLAAQASFYDDGRVHCIEFAQRHPGSLGRTG